MRTRRDIVERFHLDLAKDPETYRRVYTREYMRLLRATTDYQRRERLRERFRRLGKHFWRKAMRKNRRGGKRA